MVSPSFGDLLIVPTLVVVLLENRDIRSNRLVLPVDQNPEPEITLVDLVVSGNPRLEGRKCLGLEYSESSEIGGRQVLFIKRGEVEARMSGKAVVGNDLCREVEMLLVLFSSASLHLLSFLFQPCLCNGQSLSL